jgi:hypothetical protein
VNERIEELAEQCGFRSNPNVYDRNQSFDIEKFAELIVRECADIASINQHQYNSVGEYVLKHFGIKK